MSDFGGNQDSSFLPSLKQSKPSKFKSGSYLDDDSMEIMNKSQRSNAKHGPGIDLPASKNQNSKGRPKDKTIKQNKNPTVVDKMYSSLKNSSKETRDLTDSYRPEGPKVSINIGSNYGGNGPESMDYLSDEQPQNLNTFDIATGSINHGNR